MRGRASSASIVASPVLVGAITVLVAIVAVFLAYNANAGLPFVPTYDLKAELPSGSKLVRGNEVRVGGFRVGVIDGITTRTVETKAAGPRAVAVVAMKLDKSIEPISKDSTLIVRPRSALGLKYVELRPGKSKETLKAGSTVSDVDRLSAEQLEGPIDLEDVFSTFDERTRENSRENLTSFGDALAGRGASLNISIEALAPFVTYLTPVMKNLSDPDTELDEFFASIGRASAQVAPVARTQAVLFTNLADTFRAFSACPECLQETIEKAPGTLEVAIRSFGVQRPFLKDFTELSRRLRPAARTLRTELPTINVALKEGQPVLRRSVDFNKRTERVFGSLRKLVKNPNTKLGLTSLQALLRSGRPLLEYVAPYQTVCNYWNLFWNPLATHLSYGTTGGTYQR
ncbi:MAG: MCE family protein, partial [Thermoleophilaceae bacterium]|nr:MCE family protein [Thermoleophilaceae bacterium]